MSSRARPARQRTARQSPSHARYIESAASSSSSAVEPQQLGRDVDIDPAPALPPSQPAASPPPPALLPPPSPPPPPPPPPPVVFALICSWSKAASVLRKPSRSAVTASPRPKAGEAITLKCKCSRQKSAACVPPWPSNTPQKANPFPAGACTMVASSMCAHPPRSAELPTLSARLRILANEPVGIARDGMLSSPLLLLPALQPLAVALRPLPPRRMRKIPICSSPCCTRCAIPAAHNVGGPCCTTLAPSSTTVTSTAAPADGCACKARM